jgi:hypothetical protein
MTSTSLKLAYDRSLRRYDNEGRLHVELTPISKANICPYFGREIPNGHALGLEPDRVYQMFRAPDELQKGASTSNNIQLLEMHIGVTARDPKKQETVGSTGTDAIFDPPYLKNSLVIWDKSAIDLIESNRKKELSCSYSYTADRTPGTYRGMKYDGVMRNIAFNHVALVEDGRAGSDVLVEDNLPLLLKRNLTPMPKNVTLATSRKALVARGALQAYFSDKLAHDAQLDYSKIVRGVTAANWAEQRPVLLSRIKIATNGKLTNDKAIDGVDGVLKMLDKTGEDEMDDDADDELDEEEKKKKAVEDKRARDEEEEEKKKKEADDKRARDKRARDKRARDAMSEEEREAEDKRARDEEEEEEKKKKEAADKKARDAERERERNEDKKAMDTAIASAKKDWQREQRELNEARDLVTPVIGVVLAQDSAQAYYELLFDKHDVDTTGIPPAGFKALATQVIARVTAKPNPRPVVKHANDSAVVDFNKRFPDVARIRVA